MIQQYEHKLLKSSLFTSLFSQHWDYFCAIGNLQGVKISDYLYNSPFFDAITVICHCLFRSLPYSNPVYWSFFILNWNRPGHKSCNIAWLFFRRSAHCNYSDWCSQILFLGRNQSSLFAVKWDATRLGYAQCELLIRKEFTAGLFGAMRKKSVLLALHWFGYLPHLMADKFMLFWKLVVEMAINRGSKPSNIRLRWVLLIVGRPNNCDVSLEKPRLGSFKPHMWHVFGPSRDDSSGTTLMTFQNLPKPVKRITLIWTKAWMLWSRYTGLSTSKALIRARKRVKGLRGPTLWDG